MIREDPTGVHIDILVQPRAARNKLGPVHDQRLKVAVTAPPVDGAANQSVAVFMAKKLSVSKGRVRVVAGQTSRRKTIHIEGVSASELRAALGALGVSS